MGFRQVTDLSGPLLLLNEVQLRAGYFRGKFLLLLKFPKIETKCQVLETSSRHPRLPLYWSKYNTANQQNPQVEPALGNGTDPVFLHWWALHLFTERQLNAGPWATLVHHLASLSLRATC